MKIDTGGLSFRMIRENNKYYVDKTLLIKDILDSNELGIFLYTRPRRFGKTTNITMLDAFFNQDYLGNDWFRGLAISKYPEVERYKNAFPTINLNLKDVMDSSDDTFDLFIEGMKIALKDSFKKFSYLLDSVAVNKVDKDAFQSILDGSAGKKTLQNSVKCLCDMLMAHHGKRSVILVDEYDSALTDVTDKDLQSKIIGFFRGFFSSMLKNNQNLQLAYVTGIMQIAKSNIFSGLNNISLNSILSKRSDERFGFTENEVKEIFDYYGHSDKFEEAKEWYDGYHFGNVDVYNPFSIMSYVAENFEAKNYWANTSSVSPMKYLLTRSELGCLDEISALLDGEVVETELRETMTYEDMGSSHTIDLYSLMAMSGYLKAVPVSTETYAVSIPNREVLNSTIDIVKRIVPIDDSLFTGFNRAVLEGDARNMEATLGKILCNASHLSLASEFSYENILLTMLYGISKHYRVDVEVEAGNGRADIVLTPLTERTIPIIIELKRSASENMLEVDSNGAIEQIRDRRYFLGMKQAILVGLAFWGKIPCCKIQTYTAD